MSILQASSAELARVVAVSEGVKAVVTDAFDVELMARNAMVQAHQAGAEARGFGEVSRNMGVMSRELDASMRGLWELAGAWVRAVTERMRIDRAAVYLERAMTGQGETAAVRKRAQARRAEAGERVEAARHELAERIGEVERLAAMGWALARSARIEATYSRQRRELLTDLSLQFSRTADHIYSALKGLRDEVSGAGGGR